MQLKSICSLHDLPNSFICLSQTCKNRVGCQTCIKKHKHKYFLDQVNHYKPISQISEDISKKLEEYSTYKKANILNLQLLEYRDQIIKYFEDQEVYLQSKITEDTLNFTLEMQRASEKVTEVINKSRVEILQYWEKYHQQSMKHYNCEEEVEQLDKYFKDLEIETSKDVEEPVIFLYSQEIYLKFNLQLDVLKSEIAHYQKHTRLLTEWLGSTRKQYEKLQVFQTNAFFKWKSMYDLKPKIPSFVEEKTQYSTWQNRFLSKNQEENTNYKDLMQYKLRYETLRPVYRMARIDNQRFASSGARAIDLWNRVSYHPMKSIIVEYPSYGLTNFIDQKGQTKLLFGLSNGDLYEVQTTTFSVKKIQAHMSAIKQIVQYKNENLFLTVSQDWLIKIWEHNTSVESCNNKFAELKATMNHHSGKLNTLQIIQDHIVSGGTDGTIKLWSLNKMVVEQTFDQQRQIHALSRIREELFASGGEIRELRMWDYRIPKTPVSKYCIDLFCNSILRVDDNKILFNDKNVLKMIDIRKLDQAILVYKQEQAFVGAVGDIRYLGDKEIGTGGNDNFIVVWKC